MAGVRSVVDEFFCMVEPPEGHRADFRAGPNFAVKYVVGVRLADGHILYVSPWYPGSWPDIVALRHCGLLDRLLSGEFLLADLAFVGEGQVLHKVKRWRGVSLTQDQQFYNYVVSSLRVIVERTLNRLSVFQCFNQRWRHGLDRHEDIFQVLCQIVNVDLAYRPLSAHVYNSE